MTREELIKRISGRASCVHNPIGICSECVKWFEAYDKDRYAAGYDDGRQDENMQENSVFNRFG